MMNLRTLVAWSLLCLPVAVFAGCSGGHKQPASPAPSPAASATAAATGTPVPSPEPGKLGDPRKVDGATTRVMSPGDPYRIQQGEVWYFMYLCDACGPGPLPNLYRAYRAADGTLVIDDLKAKTAGLGKIADFTADWKSGDAYVVTCEPGRNCYSLESGDADGDAPATVYTSTDAGITWKHDGTVPPLTALTARGGQVLATNYKRGFAVPDFLAYPSGTELEPPQKLPDARPVLLPNGSIAWQANDRLYDQAGGFLFGPLFAEQYRAQVAATDIQYQHTYLTWAETDFKTGWSANPYYSYVGHIDRDGQLRDLWALPGDTLWITGEFPRSGDAPPALFGRFRFGTSTDYVRDVSFGAVLTLADGKVHRFTELDAARPEGSFVYLQALVTSVQLEKSPGRAPFYRVTGAGDCLNIRESPSLTARVFVCLADDVLVGGMETPPQTLAGIEWRQVRTPGGMLGWASTEFLR